MSDNPSLLKCVNCRNCGSNQTAYYDVVPNKQALTLYAARCFECWYSWTEEIAATTERAETALTDAAGDGEGGRA